MKNFLLLMCSLVVIFCAPGRVAAQEKAKTEITTVKQKGETVRVSLTSSRPFIFGNNRYILYIGSKEFFRNEQSKKDGKGHMTFLIPASEFSALKDGEPMYLTYGHVNMDVDAATLAQNRRCWPLGTFSKSLLK